MSKIKKDKKPVEVIVFEDPAKRSKKRAEKREAALSMSEPHTDDIKRPIFDQKAAKYDIRKVAIDGMDKSQQEIAMADFLVDLGAKKPKNKHVPIKDYIQELKKRKLEGGSDEKVGESDDAGVKKPKFWRKRENKDDILGHVDGQIGTYRRGVQFIGKCGRKKR